MDPSSYLIYIFSSSRDEIAMLLESVHQQERTSSDNKAEMAFRLMDRWGDSIDITWVQNSQTGAQVQRPILYTPEIDRQASNMKRNYVSTNQSSADYGDLGQKSWMTLKHVWGHMTLKLPGCTESIWHSKCKSNMI